MSWLSGLRPASWRGVPFSVTTAEASLARRTAVHEYPFRDDVWVEDLGAGKNTWIVTGYLVGDDVISLRDEMQAAVQEPGVGELIHPTFGSLQVAVIDWRTAERWDAGRVIEMGFTFVRAGERMYPGGKVATDGGVKDAANAADAASSGSFIDQIGSAAQQGREVVNQAVTTAQKYAGQAQRLVGDASRVLHSVGGLIPGADRTFGRFFSGARSVLGSANRVTSGASTYINRAATARSAVSRAATDVNRTAGNL